MVPAEFYTLLEDMRKTFSVGIERVSDKLDEVKSNMATHREIDEIKQRLAKTEALVELVREEAAKKSDMRSEIEDLKQENKELRDMLIDLQNKQGRIPSWIWSIAISAFVTILGWYVPHIHMLP